MLQLLRDDHAEWWTRSELGDELRLSLDRMAPYIEDLERSGVVSTEADRVCASPSARCLDALGLIGV